MALAFQLETLDGLNDEAKNLYTEKDGVFVLDVSGLPVQEDLTGLKSKVEELLAEKKAEKEKREAAEAEARKAAEEKAKKSGDVEALEKSWNEKFTKRETELQQQIDGLNASIQSLTVDKEAMAIANSVAVEGSSEVLLPHIKSRLAVEERDGKHVTVVKDADGKASALNLDDLKKEISENKAFAPLIVGSRASGGGASQSNGGAATKKFSEYTGAELSDIRAKNPAEYERLKQQHYET